MRAGAPIILDTGTLHLDHDWRKFGGGESGTRWVKVGDPPVVVLDHFQGVKPNSTCQFPWFFCGDFLWKKNRKHHGTVPWEIAGIEILFIW